MHLIAWTSQTFTRDLETPPNQGAEFVSVLQFTPYVCVTSSNLRLQLFNFPVVLNPPEVSNARKCHGAAFDNGLRQCFGRSCLLWWLRPETARTCLLLGLRQAVCDMLPSSMMHLQPALCIGSHSSAVRVVGPCC
jgi:hypothetical protein